MDVALGEPRVLHRAIDRARGVTEHAAEPARRIADEAVARRELAIGRHAEIAGTGAARVGPVGAAVELAQRVDQVGERVALAGAHPALELVAARHHLLEHRGERRRGHLAAAARRREHG